MEVEILSSAESVAARAASLIAEAARSAVNERGRFVMAVSGGRTPWIMLRALANEHVPWAHVHIFQVDERVAPEGHPDRNLTHLRESLPGAVVPEQIYAMPVESPDLEAGARQYDAALARVAGSPAVLDLVHLGLGADGHTASLVPGDPVLRVDDAEIGVTGLYSGRRRMTLTYPVIDRARRILWVVTGAEKMEAFHRLLEADPSIPAGRIRGENAVVVADTAAAGETTAELAGRA